MNKDLRKNAQRYNIKMLEEICIIRAKSMLAQNLPKASNLDEKSYQHFARTTDLFIYKTFQDVFEVILEYLHPHVQSTVLFEIQS